MATKNTHRIGRPMYLPVGRAIAVRTAKQSGAKLNPNTVIDFGYNTVIAKDSWLGWSIWGDDKDTVLAIAAAIE